MKLETIPNDSFDFLVDEEYYFIEDYIQHYRQQSARRPNSFDLLMTSDAWDRNYDALKSDIDDLISKVESMFHELEFNCIFEDDYFDFLDEIKVTIVGNNNCVKVDSPYSIYPSYFDEWYHPLDIYFNYIEKLVNNGDIILADFEIYDDIYYYTVYDKFDIEIYRSPGYYE